MSTTPSTNLAMLFDRHARLALIIAVCTLAFSGLGFRALVHTLNFHLRKEPVELRASLSSIPSRLGTWEQVNEDAVLSEALIEALGTDVYLNRAYAINGEPRDGMIAVHVAYYTGMIDAVPHVPDRCFVAAGNEMIMPPTGLDLDIDRSAWFEVEDPAGNGKTYQAVRHRNRITGREQVLHMPTGNVVLRTSEFQAPNDPDTRILAGYVFVANGQLTSWNWQVRNIAFKRSDKYAYYCKVQLTVPQQPGAGTEEFVERASDLMSELLPELARCLPDWPEVMQRDGSAPSAEKG